MATLCPHCFNHIFQRSKVGMIRTTFRCNKAPCVAHRPAKKGIIDGELRTLRKGEKIEAGVDPVLQAVWGDNSIVPHAFSVDTLRHVSSAECPVSHAYTQRKLCSSCHREVNSMSGMVHDEPFTLAGATDAGKSAYIAALIQELNGDAGGRFGLTARGIDDTDEMYDSRYETLVGVADGNGIATARAEKTQRGRVKPLVYSIDRPSSGGKKSESVTLSLYDPPGEELLSGDHIERLHAYIYRSTGVTFMIDGEAFLDAELAPARLNSASKAMTQLINKNEASRRVQPTVAIVVSKADALVQAGILDDGLLEDPAHSYGFDEAVFNSHSAEVHRLVTKRGGQGLARMAINAFGNDNVGFFACSAYGNIPINQDGDPMEPIQPRRTAEPLFWLMAMNGLLPWESMR